MKSLGEVFLFVQHQWIKIAELCISESWEEYGAVFVSFPIYNQFRIALYVLRKTSKHINKQAQIFALFVQKLFFFLCGSGQVPIKVVFQASFPCSGAGSPPTPLLSPILFESVRKAKELQVWS